MKPVTTNTFNSYDILNIDDDNFYFTPAITLATRQAIGRSVQLSDYMDIRSHFAAYSLKAANDFESGKVKYNNYLTSYYETDETIAERLEITREQCNRWITALCKKGLVVRLSFASEGKPRRNLVVLDYGLEDYIPILEACLDILEVALAKARKKGKTKGREILKQIQYIHDAIENHPNIVGKPREKTETSRPVPKLSIVQSTPISEPEETVQSESPQEPYDELAFNRAVNEFKNHGFKLAFDDECNGFLLKQGDQVLEFFKTETDVINFHKKTGPASAQSIVEGW